MKVFVQGWEQCMLGKVLVTELHLIFRLLPKALVAGKSQISTNSTRALMGVF